MLREVYKSASGSYKDVDLNKREALINFATYGSKDRDGDIANQGMFTKSWQEFTDVRLFYNHDKLKAPGVIVKMWDDAKGATAHVKFSRSTLGNDTLLEIQDEVLKDSSYLFIPQKAKQLGNGAYSYQEVFHKEVSVLTHWGAHPESKIKAVAKSADIVLGEEVMKELNSDEVQYIKNYISSANSNLQNLVSFASGLQPESDLYTWVNRVISQESERISDFKYYLKYYSPKQKSENDEALSRLAVLKSFIRNTTASDDSIQKAMKEAEHIETLLSSPGSTQSSQQSTQEQQKGSKDDEALINLQLLSLTNIF
jgi:HK97 family phage prohead protease